MNSKKKRNRLLTDEDDIPMVSSMKSSRCHVNDLPAEVLVHIFSFLKTFKEVLACESVCSFWRDFVRFGDEEIWKPKCLKKWGESYEVSSHSWKEAFFTSKENLRLSSTVARKASYGGNTSTKELRLERFQLTVVPTNALKAHIESLLLSNNRLIHLPTQLHLNPKLMHLHVKANRMERLSPHLGSSSLSCLQNLQTLDLSFNFLNQFPVEILNLRKLKELNLGSNKLEKIPEEIENLKELQVLHLFRNELKKLPETLWRLKKLRQLFINNNPKLKEIPEGIEELKELNELSMDSRIEKNVSKEFRDQIRKRSESREQEIEDERWQKLRANTTEDDILIRTRKKMEGKSENPPKEPEKSPKEPSEVNSALWDRELTNEFNICECVPTQNKTLSKKTCTIQSATLFSSSPIVGKVSLYFGVKGELKEFCAAVLENKKKSVPLDILWVASQPACIRVEGLKEGQSVHIWGSKSKKIEKLFSVVSNPSGKRKEAEHVQSPRKKPISINSNNNNNSFTNKNIKKNNNNHTSDAKSSKTERETVEILSSDDDFQKPGNSLKKPKSSMSILEQIGMDSESSSDSEEEEEDLIEISAVESSEMEKKRKEALKKLSEKKKRSFKENEAEEGSEEEDGAFEEDEIEEMERADDVDPDEVPSEDEEEILGEFDDFIESDDQNDPALVEEHVWDPEEEEEEEEEDDWENEIDNSFMDENSDSGNPIVLDDSEEERPAPRKVLKRPMGGKKEVIDLDDELEDSPMKPKRKVVLVEDSPSDSDGFRSDRRDKTKRLRKGR